MTRKEAAIQQETAAIVRVLDSTIAALRHRDFAAWASAWVHAPHVRRISSWSHGSGDVVQEGWENIGPPMKRFLTDSPYVFYPHGTRCENMNVRVERNFAFVTYDQYPLDSTGQPAATIGVKRETRMLERHSGKWQYTYSHFFHELPGKGDPALVRVDANATIETMNRAAAELIGSSESLCVRNGRLRAVDQDVDVRLLATIRETSDSDPVQNGPVRIPFLLKTPWGSSDGVCWITPAPGVRGNVVIAIGDGGASRHRLQNAILVYRLSPAQARLAEKIIEGHDLVAAAEQLGVTVHTTRTQLHRMFEKTGVRSQPALVGALLSVAAPAK